MATNLPERVRKARQLQGAAAPVAQALTGTASSRSASVVPGGWFGGWLGVVDYWNRCPTPGGGGAGTGIPGVTDGSDAAPGMVGEQFQVWQPPTAPVALAIQNMSGAGGAGVWLPVLSLTLSAGDWDVSANVAWGQPSQAPPGNNPINLEYQACLSADPAMTQDRIDRWPEVWVYHGMGFDGGGWQGNPASAIGTGRWSGAVPMTVYVLAAVYGPWPNATATVLTYASIMARRMR